MPAYASTVRRPPRTLVESEQTRLLKLTGEHRRGFRDHIILSLALGTALREHEIAALDVSDIVNEHGRIRRRVPLRVFKRSNMDVESQQVFFPDDLVYKLNKFIVWKKGHDESVAPDAPLFVSRLGKRIATRTLRLMFKTWQERAGFDQPFRFHALRHTGITNVYKRTKDVLLAQRVARHKSIQSTMIYASPSDQDVEDAMRDQPC